MFDDINEFGEVDPRHYQCHNPICPRWFFVSYINVCPNCEFSGTVVEVADFDE